jgi:hypothetical protein
VAGPFTGHTHPQLCLWHSHQMASTLSQALEDQTICVWNATTGETVAGPFTGHTDSSLVCGILTRWPARCLRLFKDQYNLCVECHYRRDGGRPIYWSHRLGPGLWHSHQMASTLSQAQKIKQFVCGRPLQEGWWKAIYWSHRSSQLCGILTRWPAHCLRLLG